MKQNHCSFLLATYSQNLEGIEQETLRYNFWTLKATAALVWPLTVKAVLQNFNNG